MIITRDQITLLSGALETLARKREQLVGYFMDGRAASERFYYV